MKCEICQSESFNCDNYGVRYEKHYDVIFTYEKQICTQCAANLDRLMKCVLDFYEKKSSLGYQYIPPNLPRATFGELSMEELRERRIKREDEK